MIFFDGLIDNMNYAYAAEIKMAGRLLAAGKIVRGGNRYLSGRMPDSTKAKKEHSSSVALLGLRLTAESFCRSHSYAYGKTPMKDTTIGLFEHSSFRTLHS